MVTRCYMGKEGKGNVFNGYVDSVRGGKHFLEVDSSDGWTKLIIHLLLKYTLKHG